jgi:hypothetical protein
MRHSPGLGFVRPLRWVVLAASVLVAAVLATTAAAAAPVVVEKNNTFTRVFTGVDECSALGYDFTITAEFQIRRSVTDFYDNSGTLLREVVHVTFVGSETNDVNGKSVPVNGQRHIVFDFVNGTITETGVLRHVTVQGQGIILHESGRVVVDLETEELLFEAGPKELFQGDLTALCEVLADP